MTTDRSGVEIYKRKQQRQNKLFRQNTLQKLSMY